MPSNQFTIDSAALSSPSRTPRHLDNRIKQRTNSSTSSAKMESRTQRREAFLAVRVKKLAQRTAHIKTKVQMNNDRLSNKRSLTLSQIEMALENANRNRKSLLEKTIAHHASHVKRAKTIARQQAQKSVECTHQLKKNIDARLRISATRRQRLLSVPRSLWGSKAFEESLALEDDSACLIQNWYRTMKFGPIADLYKRIGLSRRKASSIPFQKLVQKVQSPVLIKASGLVLIRAKKLNETPITHWKNPGRVLLSSFMLTTYPEETLLNMDAQEKDLALLADKLVSDLDHWIMGARSSIVGRLGKSFLASYMSYYEAFDAWKSRDTHKIVEELIGHFMEVDKLWVSVMHQEDAEGEWAPAVRDQQSQHLKRIKQFGPDAVKRLVGIRAEFKQFVLDSGVSVEISSTASLTDAACVLFKSIRSIEEDTVMTSEAAEAEHVVPVKQVESQFGDLLSNEQLAHDLIMDPNYTLKPQKKSPLEEQVAAIAKNAFTDTLRSEISQGIYSNAVIGVVGDIRQGLLTMLNDKGPIAHEISEVFDPEFLDHQIKNNSFELLKLVNYAGEKMLQLCAPVRDAEIRSLVQQTDMATVLIQMLDIIEGMKLDLANFRLQSIKPHLRQQSVDYERRKFRDALASQRASLEKTTVWLKATVDGMKRVADARNPEKWEDDSKFKFTGVLHQAYISLMFSTTAIDPSQIPETLVMDSKRLFDFQNELQALTIVSALTMLAKQIVPVLRKEEAEVCLLASRLLELLKLKGTNVDTLATEIISAANLIMHKQAKVISNLSQTTQQLKELPEEQVQLVKNMVDKTVSYKDPLFSVLNRRLEKVVSVILEEKPVSPVMLAKNGLDVVGGALEKVCTRIALLCKFNKDVYAEHYDMILKDLI